MVARGACMVAGGGRAWLWGAYIGNDEIRSMSGWYTSYWNAFLFNVKLTMHLLFH